MKNRVLSGAVLVALMVAIVVFNSSFPMALNIAISLVSVLAVTEIITAIGMAKNYVLMVPLRVPSPRGIFGARVFTFFIRCSYSAR